MSSVTQNQTKLTKEQIADKADGEFDAALGISPRTMELGTPYFTAYIQEVIKTGKTPF